MFYDLLAIVVVVLCVVIGYLRGAAKSLVSLVGFFVSFVLAVILGDFLTDLLYENYISLAITDSIRNAVLTNNTTSVTLPPFVSFALKLTDHNYENALFSAIEKAPETIALAFESAVKPIIVSVLSFILTAVVFIVVYIVFKLIIKKILVFLFELPVISLFNKVLGALCGVVTSVLILSSTAYLLNTLMPYMNNVPYMFCESTIYNSYIFYHFYSGNIFNAIISIF